MRNLNLETNHVAYLSRLLEERYHRLQALEAHAHLNAEHLADARTEKRVIETIQKELHPR
jgi:sRNA-binding protein